MDYMENCVDKFFDLAIVDPPYGINEAAGKNKSRTRPFGRRKDTKNTLGTVIKAKDYGYKEWDKKPPPPKYFLELFRISKNQIIWGGNFFIAMIKENSPCWIVWDKNNSGDFADCELAYTSFKTAVRKFKYTWNGMLQEYMHNKEKRIHPTQKPVALYKWLLNNYAKPGQKIIDTHLGSGSSAIAAHYFGCDFVGLEIDKDYFEAAQKRFRESTRQLAMF